MEKLKLDTQFDLAFYCKNIWGEYEIPYVEHIRPTLG